ncbi:MAG: hypothetical protein AAGF91_08340 [Actinomycetota bacterium]
MSTSHSSTADQSVNLVVVSGVLRGDVVVRTLGDSVDVAQFDLATPVTELGPSAVVPVSWRSPSAVDLDLVSEGVSVTVLGTVTKRFYRTGGVTRVTTEVVVERLVPTRRKRSVAALRSLAAERVGSP